MRNRRKPTENPAAIRKDIVTNRAVLERRRQFAQEQRRAVLDALSRQEIEQRIRTLAADGMTEHDVAALLRLHIEQIRRVLAEQASP